MRFCISYLFVLFLLCFVCCCVCFALPCFVLTSGRGREGKGGEGKGRDKPDLTCRRGNPTAPRYEILHEQSRCSQRGVRERERRERQESERRGERIQGIQHSFALDRSLNYDRG